MTTNEEKLLKSLIEDKRKIRESAEEAIRTGLHNGGFLTVEQVEAIAAEPTTRLSPVLVRCRNGRFTAPAQDVLHFAHIIERDFEANNLKTYEQTDYIRDFSLPAGFAVRAS